MRRREEEERRKVNHVFSSSGELSGILEKCCEGDVTCSEFGQFRLHGH